MTSADCVRFADSCDELALGLIDEPSRTEMARHAAGCASCRAKLDEVSWVAEQVLAAVPEMDPPPGFEQRVLQRMSELAAQPEYSTQQAPGAEPEIASIGARRSVPANARWLLAAAAVLLVLVVGAFTLGRSSADDPSSQLAARTAVITRSDGSAGGDVTLVREPRPHVLVTMAAARPGTSVVRCVLIGADGARTEVGSWSYEDVKHGVWAAGIDASLLDARRMEVLDSSGAVVASAGFAS
jgi:hypothetical protein